jgi:asparagine synthase (glutamine-hydrolysing)
VVPPLLNLLPNSYGYYNLADKAKWVNQMSLVEGADRSCLALTFFGFSESQKERLLTPEAAGNIANRHTCRWIDRVFHEGSGWDDIDRELYVEQVTRMPEHFLHISDRLSMAHGLEVRAPLVDYRIAEFAATLPSEYKIRPGSLKIILREVARRYLPPKLIDRPKRGFKFPISGWLRGQLAPFVEKAFSELELVEAGVVDARFVGSLVQEHLRGRADHGTRLWYLLNMEVWYRLFVTGESREAVKSWIDESMQSPSARPATRAESWTAS